MNDQTKQSIRVLIEAANVACKRGAFDINEAGELCVACVVANKAINEDVAKLATKDK